MEKGTLLSLPLQVSELAKGLVFTTVSLLAFFVPFSLGHPQWLVGTIVNACLFLCVGFLSKKYYLPLAILPSLGVLARGLVFGPFSFFLFYFFPFIWLGNLILILVFRKFYRGPTSPKTCVRLKEVGPLVLAAAAKFLFLYLFANIYFGFHLVPKLFLQAMGLNQLATAIAGGLVCFLIFKVYLWKQKAQK